MKWNWSRKKQKIWPLNLFYIVFTIVMCAATLFLYLYAETQRIQAKETSELMAERVNMMQEISLNFKLAMNTYSLHYTDQELNEALQKMDNYNSPDYADNAQYMLKMISYIVNGNSVISDVCFARDGQNLLSKMGLSDTDRAMVKKEIERYEPSRLYQVSEVYDNQSIMASKTRVLLTREIFSVKNMEKTGYMIYFMDFPALVNIMEGNRPPADKGIGLFVINDSQLICDQVGNSVSEEIWKQALSFAPGFPSGETVEKTVKAEGKQYVVTMERDPISQWIFCSYYMENAFLEKCIEENLWIIGCMTLICIVMVLIQLRSFWFLNETVYHLKKAMKTMESGNFVELDRKFEKKNDLSDVVAGFNRMSHSLKNVIQENYVQKLKRKETELKMLQFQINPHFLYNTLNLISSLAVLDGDGRIESIADSMAEMFRYNMQSGDTVRAEDEINLIKRYLAIQELRFPKKFQVEYQLDETLLKSRIEKFVLQPVVENIFAHNRAKGKLKIRISLKRQSDSVFTLSVWDNGFGIEKEKLADLNQKLEQADIEENQSIGIFNVNSRLKKQAGEIYGLKLYSEYGEWTEAVMTLPVCK